MTARPIRSVLRQAAWLMTLGGASAAGIVAAQPTAQPNLPIIETPGKAAPSEQAPPAANVPAPPPIPVPAITEKDVAPATPPENATAPPAAPAHRTRYDIAVIEALDKVTAESLRFEAQVNRPVRYKSLVFTLRACERSTADEPIDDSIAYLTIDSQPRAAPGGPPLAARQAFKGWMYASSPGLHPLEHPVYDAWLITCRAAAPVAAAVAPAPVKSASADSASASRR